MEDEMAMKIRLLSVALAIALITDSAEAFKIIGAGVDSCGTWTADRRQQSGAALQDEQWVVGFLSGIGYRGDDDSDPLKGMDAQGVWAWIDNYCLAHPIETVSTAAKAFNRAHPH
jgi:hypothetical protein